MCSCLAIMGAQEAKQNHATTFFISVCVTSATTPLAEQTTCPSSTSMCGGLCLLSCSGRSHDGGRGRGVGDNSSLEHGKGQGPWMVVGAHLAAPWNVEVQRTSSRKPGRELALIRSSVMPVPECQLASLYVHVTLPAGPFTACFSHLGAFSWG